MTTTSTIDNLIKKYQSEIDNLNKRINKDKADIAHLTNKIQTLKDVILEIKKTEEEQNSNTAKTHNTKEAPSSTEAEKKWQDLSKIKYPWGNWTYPNETPEGVWNKCSEELNNLIKDLNKKTNTTQVDFYTSKIWPLDLGM